MKKNSIFRSLPFKLLVGVIAGVLVGLLLSSTDGNSFSRAILNIVVTLKYILNQIINFCIPLIIIAFIAPSITQMGKNASKLLLMQLQSHIHHQLVLHFSLQHPDIFWYHICQYPLLLMDWKSFRLRFSNYQSHR